MDENALDQAAINQGRTFVWHELYTANHQGSLDFYTQALDFGVHKMSMGEMGDYTMLTKNGAPVCGTMDTTSMPGGEQIPPHWAVYLGVDDVDARLAKCQEMGAKLVVGPMDVPTVGRFCLIEDPFGAHIWLFKGEM